MKELSRRAGEKGKKIIFRMIYDRGNLKQVIKNHQPVTPKEWTGEKLKIPPPQEIPNLDLKIVNYHRPALGTFHSKFMVVDRKYGVVSSNNIQVSALTK
jgi:phosphatidylserine/phosphatidylglycerophosphate/cardiolipin synthase-like enzyme